MERLLAYRVHVYLLTFSMVLARFDGGLGYVPRDAWYIALCFMLLMVFIYLANKATDISEDSVNLAAGPISMNAREVVLWAAWTCAILPLIYIVGIWDVGLLALYALVAFLGYAYSFPLPGLSFRFKQVLFLKTFTSSLIWALPPIGALAAYTGSIGTTDVLLFIDFFCIGAAMEMLWDVRDTRGDRQYGIHTIANTFGITAVRVGGVILLMVAGAIMYALAVKTSYLGALGVALIFMFLASEGRPSWFYHATAFVWIAAFLLALV